MLKAYVVGEWNGESEDVLVFANNKKEARKLGCNFIDYDEYIDLPVGRLENVDNLLDPSAGSAYVEHSRDLLRKAGWRCEGEDCCGSCGLSTMGVERHSICGECCKCRECGCDCELEGMYNG